MASCFMLHNTVSYQVIDPEMKGGWEDTRRGGPGPWYKNVLAHAKHPVDLGDTEPVQDVRHQGLEAHVLHTSDVLSPLEVVGRPVFATLSSVIHNCANGQNFLCKA